MMEEIDYQTYDKIAALKELAKHLGLTSDGEAIRQLLELVGQAKGNGPGTVPANPVPAAKDGAVDVDVDCQKDGPADGKEATADRPADKPLPSKG